MHVLPYRPQTPAVSRRQAGPGAVTYPSCYRHATASWPGAAKRSTAAARRTRLTPPAAGVARSILSNPELEGGSMLPLLAASEAYWKALRNQGDRPRRVPAVVQPQPGQRAFPSPSPPPPPSHVHMYDAVVCGGTLGLFVATALQQRGHKVCLVDKRLVEGRSQEWNISRSEYYSLHRVGLLTAQELEQCVVSEFNPIRVGFKGGPQLWVRDCLNLGISPKHLLDKVKQKFLDAGGALLEETEFRRAEVYEDCVRVQLGAVGAGRRTPLTVGDTNRPNSVRAEAAAASSPSCSGDSPTLSSSSSGSMDDSAPSCPPSSSWPEPEAAGSGSGSGSGGGSGEVLHAQLLLDCMGHYSPIVKQMRGQRKPDGVVMVVGSCAGGFPEASNSTADLLYTFTDSSQDMQLFWEAFPAEAGQARSTYMFCYTDAHPSRPSFEQLLDTYFQLLPQYQGVPLAELSFKRVLFGAFPCYNDGPLQPSWDRILQIGDASAAQSPLSFGGFGSMLRHLPRLSSSLNQALHERRLSRSELCWIQPYQPSLAAAWLFQRSMGIAVGQLQQQGQQQGQGQTQQGQGQAQQGQGAGQGQEPLQSPGRRPGWLQLPVNHVNTVLATNFSVMQVLGERVLKPFLQDTIQLIPLSLSMTGMMLRNPLAISRVLLQVGPSTLLGWFFHFFSLVVYTLLHTVLRPLVELLPTQIKNAFQVRRFLEALEYGSGLDSHGTLHVPGQRTEAAAGSTSTGSTSTGVREGSKTGGSGSQHEEVGPTAAASTTAELNIKLVT